MENKINDNKERTENTREILSEALDNVKDTEFNTLPFRIIQKFINTIAKLFNKNK